MVCVDRMLIGRALTAAVLLWVAAALIRREGVNPASPVGLTAGDAPLIGRGAQFGHHRLQAEMAHHRAQRHRGHQGQHGAHRKPGLVHGRGDNDPAEHVDRALVHNVATRPQQRTILQNTVDVTELQQLKQMAYGPVGEPQGRPVEERPLDVGCRAHHDRQREDREVAEEAPRRHRREQGEDDTGQGRHGSSRRARTAGGNVSTFRVPASRGPARDRRRWCRAAAW